MSDEKENGGPAFPVADLEGAGITPSALSIGGHPAWAGMNLVDYFAGQALAGIANEKMLAKCASDGIAELTIVNAAALAYALSRAMINERNRPHD